MQKELHINNAGDVIKYNTLLLEEELEQLEMRNNVRALSSDASGSRAFSGANRSNSAARAESFGRRSSTAAIKVRYYF